MGRWKPRLPWPGHASVLDATMEAVRLGGCLPVLVCGYRGCELASLYAGTDCLPVLNPRWEDGMVASVLAGARRAFLHPDCKTALGFLVLPADMPLVKPATIRLMAREGMAGGEGGPALFPNIGGRDGHPVWIARSLLPELCSHPPRGGFKAFLEASGARRLAVDDGGIVLDMDTDEDYRRLFAMALADG